MNLSENVPKEEAELLLKINRNAPPALQARYDELIAKRIDETLASDEYRELLQLTDQMEGFDVERLHALVELARLRKTSLDDLMNALAITPPACI
jgi:hypothetical protein